MSVESATRNANTNVASALSTKSKFNVTTDRRKSCMPSVLKSEDKLGSRDGKTDDLPRYASPRALNKNESTQSIPPCIGSPFLAPKFYIGPGNNSNIVKNVMK